MSEANRLLLEKLVSDLYNCNVGPVDIEKVAKKLLKKGWRPTDV